MEKDIGERVKNIRADGGASANSTLLQFQSDISMTTVERPEILESTALGVAYFAGLAIGFWNSCDELVSQYSVDKIFTPSMPENRVEDLIENWHKAIEKV